MKYYIGIFLGILLGIAIIGALGHYEKCPECPELEFKQQKCYNQCDSYDMEKNPRYGQNGVFFGHSDEQFMCVWLENRTYADITQTIHHETLHALIYKWDSNSTHFCQ